jgi:hypothetical protein
MSDELARWWRSSPRVCTKGSAGAPRAVDPHGSRWRPPRDRLPGQPLLPLREWLFRYMQGTGNLTDLTRYQISSRIDAAADALTSTWFRCRLDAPFWRCFSRSYSHRPPVKRARARACRTEEPYRRHRPAMRRRCIAPPALSFCGSSRSMPMAPGAAGQPDLPRQPPLLAPASPPASAPRPAPPKVCDPSRNGSPTTQPPHPPNAEHTRPIRGVSKRLGADSSRTAST